MTSPHLTAESQRPVPPGRNPVSWHRLRSPLATTALVLSFIGAIGTSLGSVFAGRLAQDPTWVGVELLAVSMVGAALADMIGRTLWAGVVDRAEGALRADLIDAAMEQPLQELSEQAVGEVLDRIDDDTHEVGSLVRMNVWGAIRTLLAAGPLWLVAGLTWWPAFIMFPMAALAVAALVRPLLPQISERKVEEEAAWTDHAAVFEEGVAGRDDLRTSLGQAHVLRALVERSAEIFRRLEIVLQLETKVIRRSGVLLHGLLAVTALVGVLLTIRGQMSVAHLVTLFLATSIFVGQLDQLARHVPDLQAGFGAVLRLRGLLSAPAEPTEGALLAAGDGVGAQHGAYSVEFRDLAFSYLEGRFALQGVSLTVPAGTTTALVGRSGSGKSTLASLVSRAVEPEPGTVFVGGRDVLELNLSALRTAVGVVTQKTDILSGTLAENIALFAAVPRERIEAAVAELGLGAWVSGLDHGLDTKLGPGGATLSAGEQQLVAFARLMVRDVQVVILDEATARMDALTESRVVRAADRLLQGRTGILIAHRLSTTARADHVAVLDHGQLLQAGPRAELAATPGAFRELLHAAEGVEPDDLAEPDPEPGAEPGAELGAESGPTAGDDGRQIGTVRRVVTAPPPPALEPVPSLASATFRAITLVPKWGLLGVLFFFVSTTTGAFGVATGWAWGRLIQLLRDGEQAAGPGQPINPGVEAAPLQGIVIVALLAAPLALAYAIKLYPGWWVSVMLAARTKVLAGQIATHRLVRTPPGEVVARAMDADRMARYADRWVDVFLGSSVVILTALVAGSWMAGLVLVAVMAVSAVVSTIGRPIAGRSATASSAARANFGRYLVSALESVRTVKLAAATPQVHRHLREVDAGRVDAAVFEHRVQALLDGVPTVMVNAGVVAAWAGMVAGQWSLGTAILVAGSVSGFDWFGKVAGAVITEAPGTRSWQLATSEFAGGGELTDLPEGLDIITGQAPAPAHGVDDPLRSLTLESVDVIHDDGTVGVTGVDLQVKAGELVLLLGPVGSGKSSLLAGLAGLVPSTGRIRWNGQPVDDPQRQLRPGRVAHVAQVPKVLSGTWRDNVLLDHSDRNFEVAAEAARLTRDVADAGGPDTLVGHRGVRLSGGQVQRLALARALACDAQLLLADDVSSALDATTEVELWQALRQRKATVLGATSKTAALAQADRVVVLMGGSVVATGPWRELSGDWGHLAG